MLSLTPGAFWRSQVEELPLSPEGRPHCTQLITVFVPPSPSALIITPCYGLPVQAWPGQ